MEVVIPSLLPGIKERNDFFAHWVHSREVWPFIPIAKTTGQRQVFGFGRPAMLPSDDVIKLEREFGKNLWKVAVLTTPSSSLPDQTLQRRIHRD